MITNIAAYRFVRLENLRDLRQHLLSECKAWGLKGTILLSPEGINLFVAGGSPEIDQLVSALRSLPGMADLSPKFSQSADQPFSRMLVRIKKEIIAFGVEGIEPGQRTSPKLSARELKQWLDEGRPVTLLDTRNDYEVKLGTFRNATTLGIDHFREFPAAVDRLPQEMRQTPVVMFCTGGIRCEKAGPYMEREGFQNIFQLDGGILKYFEEVGGDHYEGECFVFDQRVGVDPALRETDSAICFACQTPLDAAEQADPRFVLNVSCPYCHRSSADEMATNIERRHALITQFSSPLPGSTPVQNERPLNIPAIHDGQSLQETLAAIFPHIAPEEWAEVFAHGYFLRPNRSAASLEDRVCAGERYLRIIPAQIEPEVNPDIRILHEDEAIVVLEKPAPLPMHPGGRFNRNTLQFILNAAYAPQKIQAAHRLDANTTGLVVCTRTRHFARLLQPRFTHREVEKIYLVRVQGHPAANVLFCDAPIGNVVGRAGSREIDGTEGQSARTEFVVLRRDEDGTALLEARPLTGRTNQIRLHLARMEYPVCGDPTYLADGQTGDTQTLPVGAPPLCLHAWKLTFRHPLTDEMLHFTASLPAWAEPVAAQF